MLDFLIKLLPNVRMTCGNCCESIAIGTLQTFYTSNFSHLTIKCSFEFLIIRQNCLLNWGSKDSLESTCHSSYHLAKIIKNKTKKGAHFNFPIHNKEKSRTLFSSVRSLHDILLTVLSSDTYKTQLTAQLSVCVIKHHTTKLY